ncbi:MAG: ABC transporter substrate-binding protein [Bacteroidales bacterium]|nr:ABC transporter substrate-binding protein [Bacteroidales bacterium]
MKNILRCILAATLILACSCQRVARQDTADTVTYTDDYGNHIVLTQRPHRIVSTSPAVTEIMFALGADSLLVGRTDFCNYPPQAASIESIGGISNLNVEKILSLSPDLVISGSMIPQKSAQHLENMGVKAAYITEKPHFEGLYDNIAAIGLLTGYSHAADSLIAVLRQEELTLRADSLASHPTVYYVVGFGPTGNFTAGGNSFINDVITLAGGVNIARNMQGWAYSTEALVAADPDYIVIRREDSAAFCNCRPYNHLSAVGRHHVIGIESGTIDLQVPRNMEAVTYLRKHFN